MEHLVGHHKVQKKKAKVPKVIKEETKPSVTPLLYKDSRYFPLTTSTLTDSSQLIWIAIYILIWVGIAAMSYERKLALPLGVSFSVGLALLIGEQYYAGKDNWIVLNSKDNETYELAMDRKTGGDAYGNNERWLVYTDDKHIPVSNDKAYLLETDNINKLQTKEGVKFVPLGAMFDGLFSKTVNIGSQDKVRFFSEYNTQLGLNCYYVIVLILAWSLYVVKTKWFRIKNVHWVLIAISVSTLGGVLTNSPTTIGGSNRLIEVKKKILIIAISLASASILIN